MSGAGTSPVTGGPASRVAPAERLRPFDLRDGQTHPAVACRMRFGAARRARVPAAVTASRAWLALLPPSEARANDACLTRPDRLDATPRRFTRAFPRSSQRSGSSGGRGRRAAAFSGPFFVSGQANVSPYRFALVQTIAVSFISEFTCPINMNLRLNCQINSNS
ncbi:hypothetical protein DO72_5479 [Burkholderia pseudomallei]|nr:hypothetical protein DO72_5479 [Burkholderia pseudomallei]